MPRLRLYYEDGEPDPDRAWLLDAAETTITDIERALAGTERISQKRRARWAALRRDAIAVAEQAARDQ